MAKVVAIGASQGGVPALQTIVRGLPSEFEPAVLVVLHVGAGRSELPSILNASGGLVAAFPQNAERIKPGRVYVAPPDLHMMVVDGHIELSRGPRENWARPAIDPLFRSVAEFYGPEAIGVILSGRLNDGTIGLHEIKRRHGIAIVQNPNDAEAESMPRSALDNVSIDYCLPVADIAPLLVRLARESVRLPSLAERGPAMSVQERPVALTCPECGGAMREEKISHLTRFRCHTGHAMTGEVMAVAQLENLEHEFAAVFRALKERAELCSSMADETARQGDTAAAAGWKEACEQATAREATIRQLLEAEWLHPEGGAEEQAAQ